MGKVPIRGYPCDALLASLMVALCVAGCQRVDDGGIPGDSMRSGWASPARPSTLPAAAPANDFLAKAAEASLFEIEASRIALTRASSSAVRRYAETTLRDRVSIDIDLKQLAVSVGVALPSRLSENLRARLAVLEQLNGVDFDRAYARNVGVLVPQEALAAFERAADGHGERVQRFAAACVPVLRLEVERGRRLSSEVDQTGMA